MLTGMAQPLLDAHCHLHHPPLPDRWADVHPAMLAVGCGGAIVNGTEPDDWPDVQRFVEHHPNATPAFGIHPWRTEHAQGPWLDQLRRRLLDAPAALVGEIGLDHARPAADRDHQAAVFRQQLALAAELDRPCCIHCVQAHGQLVEFLEADARPSRFMMHGYGGSAEMISRYARLGAFFSFSPATLARPKTADALRAAPPDRLLLETDAPYMPAPPDATRYELPGKAKARWQHPANLIVAYEAAARILDSPLDRLRDRLADNYRRFTAAPSPRQPR